MKNIIHLYIYAVAILLSSSCKKFLDKKSDESLSIPQTIADLQALADNPILNNSTRIVNNLTDEYYITHDLWQSLGKEDQESYVWDANLNAYDDWVSMYNYVLYCNTILDNIDKIDDPGPGHISTLNSIQGRALFLRSYYFYKVAELYAPPFNATSAKTDLGIPLRLIADFNVPATRSTLEETYRQIIEDLLTAAGLLKDNLPTSQLNKTRPTITACYGMLARVYLQTGNAEKAMEYAGLCMGTYNKLLDFNDATQVDPGSQIPISKFNQEVIFYSAITDPITATQSAIIDSTLYRSFDNNDLRKKVYFQLNPDGTPYFKGSYNGGTSDLFQGIAMDEIYLIRAEAAARTGNANMAMTDLNTLLSKRYSTGTYIPYTGLQPDEILKVIIRERRKEMIYRGTRWADLKRLNQFPESAVTMKRSLNNQLFELPPNDLRFALLIPIEVINKSHMPQNKR